MEGICNSINSNMFLLLKGAIAAFLVFVILLKQPIEKWSNGTLPEKVWGRQSWEYLRLPDIDMETIHHIQKAVGNQHSLAEL